MWNTVFTLFKNYMGVGFMAICYLVSVAALIMREKNKPRRVMFIYVPMVLLILFFCPLFFKVFFALLESEVYFRILWLIPWSMTIAYAAVKMAELFKGKARIIYGIAVVLAVVFSGKLVYDNPLYTVAENIYHVPDYVVDVCDMIEVEGREVKAVFPKEFILYVRQYSPTICMGYGRQETLENPSDLAIEMRKDHPNAQSLAELSRTELCHYIILSEETETVGSLTDYEFEEFGRADGYIIYRDKNNIPTCQ